MSRSKAKLNALNARSVRLNAVYLSKNAQLRHRQLRPGNLHQADCTRQRVVAKPTMQPEKETLINLHIGHRDRL